MAGRTWHHVHSLSCAASHWMRLTSNVRAQRMASPSPLEKLRNALAELQKSGQESVDISTLINFVDSIEAHRPLDPELRKLQHESNLAKYKADADGKLEMFRSVMESAKSALSTSILVNGGASVALLALIGNLAGKSPAISPLVQPGLASAMAAFALGVLLGALATGGTYCSQYLYQRQWWSVGAVFHTLTASLVVASYVAFAAGIYYAYSSLA
jgi:hypothetical protein